MNATPCTTSPVLCSCDACGSDVTDVDQILCAACRLVNRRVDGTLAAQREVKRGDWTLELAADWVSSPADVNGRWSESDCAWSAGFDTELAKIFQLCLPSVPGVAKALTVGAVSL